MFRDGLQYHAMSHHTDDANPDLPPGEVGGPDAESDEDDFDDEEGDEEDDEDRDEEDDE